MKTIDCPRCKHEHEPIGIHEDDSGEQECQWCGFKFHVEINYSPTYLTCCMIHKFGSFETRSWEDRAIECRFCVYCGKCQLHEESEAKKLNGGNR